MSTLCLDKWELLNVLGARPFYRAVAAHRRIYRAALPDKDVSGGTPTTARGMHALPIHSLARIPSAPLENAVKGWLEGGRKVSGWTEGRSGPVKVNQSESKRCGERLKAEG